MKPLTALLAILAGSAVALATGLIMTWIVILLLPEDSHLVRAILVFSLFAGASGASFYGQLRERRWRGGAHGATLAVFALVLWLYWPQ
jgi:hypothetical protein